MEKILVVDDEQDNLKILNLYLKQKGYETLLCQYPLEAKDLILKEKPDLIILDIMMPELDGFSLCKQIKSDSRISDIPIIFLTARYLDKKDLVEGLSIGAIDYITKPFDENELFARIRAALRVRKAELELKQERDFLNTVINSVGSDILIIREDLTVDLANKSFLNRKNLKLADIKGRHCYDFTFGKEFCLQADECPAKKSFSGVPHKDIIEVNTDSGTRYINISSYPIYDADGKVRKIVEIHEDITSEILKEKHIQQINILLENLISRMNEGLIFIGMNRQIIKMNDKAKEIVQKTARMNNGLVESICDTSVEEIFNEISGENKFFTRTCSIGDSYYKINASPLFVDEKEGVLITFNDITSELKSQEELIQSAKLVSIGELAASIAHEINNPITGIIGYAELLGFYKDLLPKKVLDVIDKMQKESLRVKNIIENLLKFSRKQQVTDMSYNDLTATLSEVSFLISAALEENNIKLEMDIQENLPLVYCNSGLIQQVVLNLLQNAFDAIVSSKKGSRISLKAFLVGSDRIHIIISDNGPGIPENIREKIFQPFFTTKSHGKGTGLGLSLVHRIVQMHEGDISFETSKEGTTFKIELPVNRTQQSSAIKEDEEKADVEISDYKKALIIDDDMTIREYLADILFTFKFKVDEAKDAVSASRLIDNNDYDVIILDIRLPDSDGFNIYYDLLHNRPELAKRIFFITGDVGLDMREKLKKTGRPFLIKPFNFNDLLSILGIR